MGRYSGATDFETARRLQLRRWTALVMSHIFLAMVFIPLTIAFPVLILVWGVVAWLFTRSINWQHRFRQD